ncbi:MAG: hypothetical protein ACXWDO_04780 [Bacteroidia bacterium]
MRIIPVVFCLVYSLNGFAQKNEIGTNLLSYHVSGFSDRWNNIGNSGHPIFDVFTGISYKRFIKQHIIRSSFTYRSLSGTNKVPPPPYGFEGDYKESIFKLGYEKELNHRKFAPYISLDFAFYYFDFQGFYKVDGMDQIHYYEVDGCGIGVTPGFGLKYKFTEKFSVQAESCLDLAYFINDEVIRRPANPFYPLENFKTHEFIPRFNPLQKLSLNVKF